MHIYNGSKEDIYGVVYDLSYPWNLLQPPWWSIQVMKPLAFQEAKFGSSVKNSIKIM